MRHPVPIRRRVRLDRLNGMQDPRSLPGLALWLNANDPSSLIYDGSNRTALVGDKSGNSAENGLVLNGSSQHGASTPASAALGVSGDLALVVDLQAPAWGGGADVYPLVQYDVGQLSYSLILRASGALGIDYSLDGSTILSASSTEVIPIAAYARGQLAITRASANGNIKFFHRPSSGAAWTQFGATDTAGPSGSLHESTQPLWVGSLGNVAGGGVTAIVYRAAVYDGIPAELGGSGGTAVLDEDFTRVTKLATSFTESSANAATVTINTSGATGARIAGARDLYQGTVGSQPAYSLANRTLTFDGVDDFLKTAAFALNQPTTVYFVGSQVTWTSGRPIFDGGSNDTMELYQETATPGVTQFGGATGAALTSWDIGQRALITAVFSGAGSLLRRNADVAATGNAGTSVANGFTFAQKGGAAANTGNITVNEIAIYNVAHTAAQQQQFWAYARRKWGIV